MQDAAIQAEGLRKSYGNVQALAGIDLEAPAGTILGLLGPNGAGKTTAVRILTTLLPPDGGTARVAGLDVVRDAAALRAQIGLAGQYAAVDENLTGRENLEMVGRLYHMRRAPSLKRADELLERFDLTDAARRLVRTYSGGMRRRLDLASALVHTPEVLFLDEPTTGLDPVSRRAIWDEVRKLNAEGTTVFLTTQYLEEADRLADRVGIISAGRLVAEGTPSALKAEVGRPHLELSLVDQPGKEQLAERVLSRFGRPLPARDGTLMVELERGSSEIGPIVVALNQEGLEVEHLDLVQPTLDDVFVQKTGQHLEGASEDTGDIEAVAE
jgi:ABC-2 type transport system ATP-binding protein